MVLAELFVYDDQKFPSQVVLNIAVPWRVVPCDLSFLIFALSCYLPCLRIELNFVMVATFFKRVLVWADSFIKDLIVFAGCFSAMPWDGYSAGENTIISCLASCTAVRFLFICQRALYAFQLYLDRSHLGIFEYGAEVSAILKYCYTNL